jgi:hypothetical protein
MQMSACICSISADRAISPLEAYDAVLGGGAAATVDDDGEVLAAE